MGSEHFNVCFTLSADGNILDFAAARLFDIRDIIKRFFGQIFLLAAFGNIAMPAFHRFEHGLAFAENRRSGEFLDLFAIAGLRRADFDFFVIG